MLSFAALLCCSYANAQNALTCNSPGIQVSVDNQCQKLLSADDVLEGDPVPGVQYFLMLKIGNRIVESGPAPLLIDGRDLQNRPYRYINRTLRAEIFDGDPSLPSSNSCWTDVSFEDKLPPTIIGDDTFAATCLDDLDCIATPTAIDNCSIATVNLTNEQIISSDICNDIQIVRTYIAFDEDDNTSAPFVVNITVSQAPVVFPRDIEFTCQQYAAYPSITDASERLACVFDTRDDNGDGILSSDDDDDDDLNTPFSQDNDPISVGLVPGTDDTEAMCPGGINGELDPSPATRADYELYLDGLCGAPPACNLTQAARGIPPFGRTMASTEFGCPVLGNQRFYEDDDILAITGAGLPNIFGDLGNGFCSYAVSFQDDTLATCGGAAGVFKIIRDWRVVNWCTGTITMDQQLIKVTDRIAPLLTIAPSLQISANVSASGYPGLCGSSGLLPAAQISDDCSGIDLTTVTVNTPAGVATPVSAGGAIVGYRIPAPFLLLGGPYTVTYSASDNCGNNTSVTTQVTVVDNTPPIAICDEITNLSLTGTSATAILAARLDDGSYDQCNDVFFKVIRMDELSAGNGVTQGRSVGCDDANSEEPIEGGNTTAFDDEAFFCCDDIATNNNMVVVRVFDVDPGDGAVRPVRMNPGGDLFGRFNDCMVEVMVEDKVAPVKVLPNTNRTILCTDNALRQQYADPTQLTFDAPLFVDNCDFTVSLTVLDGTGNCGDGVIRRRFQATDDNGNTSVLCEQRITVLLTHDYTILFPNDVENLNCGNGINLADTLTDDDISEDGCDLLAISYTDQRFTADDDACYKILRTYDIINWCEWDGVSDAVRITNPTFTNAGPRLDVVVNAQGVDDVRINFTPTSIQSIGRFEYVQSIKVYDDIDPVVTVGTPAPCDPLTAVDDVAGLGCGTGGSIPFTVTDNCADDFDVTYFLVRDVDDANGDGIITTAELSTGVSFEGIGDGDPFGTLSNVGGTFTVNGTFPLGTNVLVVTVDDRCANLVEVRIPFESVDCKPPTPKALNGVAIDLMITGMVRCGVSRIDNGSFDACGGVKLLIKRSSDPRSAADTSILLTCADLGSVLVDLIVIDDAGNEDFVETYILVQDNLGACSSPASPRISASLTTDGGNGVGGATVNLSGDASMTQTTTASGAAGFDVTAGGDYTVSALLNADPANGVTTYDLYLIGQHILGVTPLSTFTQLTAADANNSASISAYDMTVIRRVILGLDANFQNNTSWRFFNADNTASEVVSFNDVQAAVAADFLAVKVGDVNGTAQANSRQALAPRTVRGEFALEAADAVLAAGETATVAFSASDATALGYQLTIEWDADALEVVAVNGAAHTEAGFGTHLLAEGKLTLSHDGEMAGELFSLEVRALRDGVALSEVLVAGSSVTAAEAYGLDGDRSVALRFSGADAAAGYALEQNRPNPFAGTTRIAFTLAEAGQAALTVTDIAGRVVWRTTGKFAQGRTEVEIAASELPAAGVLSYTLTAGEFTATRKMVVIE